MTVRLAVLLALPLLAAACAQVPSTGVKAIEPAAVPVTTNTVPAALPPAAPPPVKVVAVAIQPPPEETAPPEAAPPAPPKTVWERIKKGYKLPELDTPLVKEWENWYSSRPDYVARMIERSSRILFHVIEEVERRGMPSEIALLPMIESAYNPVAYSRSHASGIWQFIPSTGKLYGLRQNWWYDGRRDIVAATNAALDYLEKLYGMFGSWDLALASYNWGEGAVSRAMARNEARGLPTDYMSLSMPAETRGYVPKLIAVKNIITNPARYGLQIADVPNEPYFATVPVKRHIDVKLAAKLAEISLEEFKFLNPAHNKPVIKRGAGETIVLPKNKVDVFLANLKNNDQPLVSWQAHTVKPGERPEKIAARYGMTLHELKEVNGIGDRKKIATGQPLLVPLVDATAEPHLPDLPATPVTLPKAVKEARYATKHTQTAAGHLQHVKVVKRNGAKATKVAERPAPAQRVRVALKKRVAAAKKIVVKAKPAAPTQNQKKVMVAENRKER
ncbi:MAG: transglycosylase SLT domain-containing protein [Rhodospirillaceae bacterium]